MRIKPRLLTIFLLCFLLSSFFPVSGTVPDMEWKVSLGDTMNYVFTKVYSYNISDATTTYVHYMPVQAMNGSSVSLAYTNGTKFSIEVTELEDRFSNCLLTVKGITYKAALGSFVDQTTDNLTYWETLVGTKDLGALKANASLDGEEFILEELRIISQYNQTQKFVFKKNWKTGWLTYSHRIHYQNVSGEHVVISEVELMTEASTGIPGFDFSVVLLCLPLVLIFACKRRP